MKITVIIALLCAISLYNPDTNSFVNSAFEDTSVLSAVVFADISPDAKACILDLKASGRLYITYANISTSPFLRADSPDPGYGFKLVIEPDEAELIQTEYLNRINSQAVIELTAEEFTQLSELIMAAYESEVSTGANAHFTYASPDGVFMVINDKSYFFLYYMHGYPHEGIDGRIESLYERLCILSGFNGIVNDYARYVNFK